MALSYLAIRSWALAKELAPNEELKLGGTSRGSRLGCLLILDTGLLKDAAVNRWLGLSFLLLVGSNGSLKPGGM